MNAQQMESLDLKQENMMVAEAVKKLNGLLDFTHIGCQQKNIELKKC